jgi:hypothetical protein
LSSLQIPMDLEEWRTNGLSLLNELIKYRDIESDNFDFKSKDIVFGKKGDNSFDLRKLMLS